MIVKTGNIANYIDCDKIIKQLELGIPPYFIGPEENDEKEESLDFGRYWIDLGYQIQKFDKTNGFEVYLPRKHFDYEIVEKFVDFFGIDEVNNVWISRIIPNQVVPPHWDMLDSGERELLKFSDKPRYHCHLSKPDIGHILYVKDQYFHNIPQGDVYKWSSRKFWHSASNFGNTNNYMFHLW